MQKSVMVAGGAGYIGSHVCKSLAAAGYLPVTLDDLSAGNPESVQWGPMIEASVADAEAVAVTVKKYAIEAVIDLAGSIEVAESMIDPLKFYHNNAAIKLKFLRVLHNSGVRAFVFSSTAAVYGEPVQVPIPETHPRQPKNPYGWSKLMFEHILQDFHAAGGPAYMALRYFNAAGASPDGEIGECHDPESHLIPRACLAALGQIPALHIFGNDYDTPDGTAIRDYVHVMDLAAAHVLAVEKLLEGAPSAVYNLGNGVGTSIGQILESFQRMGVEIPHAFSGRRPGDPVRLVADASAARMQLGWQPRYADTDSIVRSAYRWHQTRK